MLKGFISYAYEDRTIAHKIKRELAAYHIECFLAHEDIKPSIEWQVAILRHLKECDLFFPLVSERFQASNWTDQEVGMAIAWSKPIVPFSLEGVAPYGFMGKYQAVKVKHDDIVDRCWMVIQTLCSSAKIGQSIQDTVMESFLASDSFDESARKAEWLTKIGGLSLKQLNRLLEGSAHSQDIYGGFKAREVVSELVRPHEKAVNRRLLLAFRASMARWS